MGNKLHIYNHNWHENPQFWNAYYLAQYRAPQVHVVMTTTGAPFFDAPHKPRLQQSEGSEFNFNMKMFFLE